MTCPEWLTARPIAHRGLHDAERGVIENTSSAVAAAVQAGYAIEVDLQRSADGEAMVFHDDALGRLTEAGGLVRDRTAAELKRLAFKDTADRMMTLGELLDLVGGRTPLVLELKSHFDGDIAIAMRTAALLRGRAGPIAAMSFDPRLVATIGWRTPEVLRGLGARRPRKSPRVATERAGAAQRRSPALVLQAMRARPHFIACRQQDLATAPALIARHLLRLPFLAWTVRSEQERRKALRHADQVIFEGFRPQVQPR
ncbi:MAG: glycerophosphodiester phosphodiesterase family protein [Xanthobacteraceae bacterium]